MMHNQRNKSWLPWYGNYPYGIRSDSKLIIMGIKLSLTMSCLMDFQSRSVSPSRVQMDSRAIFTAGGGLGSDLTSDKCCFLMDFTAIKTIDQLDKPS